MTGRTLPSANFDPKLQNSEHFPVLWRPPPPLAGLVTEKRKPDSFFRIQDFGFVRRKELSIYDTKVDTPHERLVLFVGQVVGHCER